MLAARKIKTDDEIALLDHAAAIVDAVYERDLPHAAPRHHASTRSSPTRMKLLFELGSEQVEAINAVSGDRCNPHPHVFSDRLLRPGDQAFFDIIHSFMGYRTCYYRTFSVGGATPVPDRRLQAVPRVARRRDRPRPAGRHHRPDRRGLAHRRGARLRRRGGVLRPPVRARPRRRPLRVADDLAPALASTTRSSSRRAWSSRSRPTARPATAVSAARIEEEVLVTADGSRDPHPLPRRRAAGRRPHVRPRRRPGRPDRDRGGRRALPSDGEGRAAPGAIRADWAWPASAVIVVGTVLLFPISAIIEPQSTSKGEIDGICRCGGAGDRRRRPDAGHPAGRIDLSVPGMISLTVVIITHHPAGDSSKLFEALLLAYGCAIVAGLIAGTIVSRIGITAILTTLGMNALSTASTCRSPTAPPRPPPRSCRSSSPVRCWGSRPRSRSRSGSP